MIYTHILLMAVKNRSTRNGFLQTVIRNIVSFYALTELLIHAIAIISRGLVVVIKDNNNHLIANKMI